LPYYWFDGGCLLQSILWPMAGGFGAVNITCIIGMIVAVPMFALSLMSQSFLAVVLWVLLFSSAYTKRRQLQAQGPGGELAEAISWSAQNPRTTGARSRKWFDRSAARAVAKQNAQIRREREKVDRILAKVSEKGMHSLSWLEKRALRKATQRQKKAGR
jgi:hypothetical protein